MRTLKNKKIKKKPVVSHSFEVSIPIQEVSFKDKTTMLKWEVIDADNNTYIYYFNTPYKFA